MLLLITFLLVIVMMIVAMSKYKVHPFIAIMAASLLLALLVGIPLVDHKLDDKVVPGVVTVIGQGFSSIFSSIGIVIILGAFIGAILEETGAALKLADMMVSLVGKRHPVLAMELMGWIVSIPVFCDSGFVVLNPIRRSLVKRMGTSSVAMTVALSAGLYLTHVFVPPTPGPLASANALGIADNLLMVMGLGVVCSILPLIVGCLFAQYIGKKVKSADEQEVQMVSLTYEELVASYGKLPNPCNAMAPIIVPILLMATSSVISVLGIEGSWVELISFISTPLMALTIGACFAAIQLWLSGKASQLNRIMGDTLKTVGPILFITAAGGVLGKIVASSDLVNVVTEYAETLSNLGIFFPFLFAALLKTSMGSSTVSIITTAGIMYPLLSVLGLSSPVQVALVCMAISAGAMTVSHANDSYFWVVTNFGSMTPQQGYRTHTLCTLLLGLSAIFEIYLLSLFL